MVFDYKTRISGTKILNITVEMGIRGARKIKCSILHAPTRIQNIFMVFINFKVFF